MEQSPHPIRAFREAQDPKMKLRELARRVGTSTANLSRIENGRQTISEDLLPKLQTETGIPAERLRPDLAKMFGVSQPEAAE